MGKRGSEQPPPLLRRDHPRVCGEKVSSTSPMKCLKGSPRVCGEKQLAARCNDMNGITPRVCGEKCTSRIPLRTSLGSPPRMRGKSFPPLLAPSWTRDHPACAGKSKPCKFRKATSWDHPRVCGEKISIMMWIACLTGSPPRMRGKAFWQSGEHQLRGITPAYAGKDPEPHWRAVPAGITPRMRGKVWPCSCL